MQNCRKSAPARLAIGALSVLILPVFTGCASLAPQSGAGDPAPTVASAAVTAPTTAAPQPRANPNQGGELARAQAPTPPSPEPESLAAAIEAAAAATARATAPAAPEISVWQRIRAGFAMPELNTPLVADKERFYLARPDYLQRMFQRGSRYLYYIVDEIEKRGMPTELALLPFVESAMNPAALSSAQAAGLWQFIPSTGKAYELSQNWWVDDRRDVVRSTQAALDYLQKIHAMHGNDWFLALASYNWGEGAVGRAVRKNQARGRPTGYLHLDMPAETRHYVPKLIALKNILLRADELGVALPDVPNRPYFVTIEKSRPIDLRLAAQFARMSVEEFVALNPAHNRPVISASRNNEIKLPADRLDDFLAAVGKHEEAQKAFATWQPYTLKSGETIESLAQRKGVAASEIRKANGLGANQRIIAGTRLLAPLREVADERQVEQFVAPRVYEQVERPARYHTVRNKESLASIARRYGVPASTLAAWNGVKDGVRAGMRLLVAPAATQTLLTREDGARSVVASAPKAGIVKTSLRQPADDLQADAPVPDAKVPPRTATRAAARNASRTASRPAATSPAPAKARTPSRTTQAREAGGSPAKRAVSAAPRAPERQAPARTPLRADSDARDGSA